ncbi:MAG TPA: hypothetical protein VN345_18520 [Blastocatellia bacterium]|jgi:hypothetical protein|nr:hypothetical protein [Blastocatellia bacterium]
MTKKPSQKKSSGAQASSSGTTAAAPASNRKVVIKQPQVKQQAAVAHGMFLFTNDAWSLQYFDPNDLHCKEREVFG